MGYAYLVSMGDNAGLTIVDISDPSAIPIEIGYFLPQRERVDVRGVDVSGSYAYVAAGYSGFSVVDISDPRNPREVGHHETPHSARSVRVSGSYAYVGELNWLRVFDVSTPSAPLKIASYEAPGNLHHVSVADSRVYVAANEAGLVILGMEEHGSDLRKDRRGRHAAAIKEGDILLPRFAASQPIGVR